MWSHVVKNKQITLDPILSLGFYCLAVYKSFDSKYTFLGRIRLKIINFAHFFKRRFSYPVKYCVT